MLLACPDVASLEWVNGEGYFCCMVWILCVLVCDFGVSRLSGLNGWRGMYRPPHATGPWTLKARAIRSRSMDQNIFCFIRFPVKDGLMCWGIADCSQRLMRIFASCICFDGLWCWTLWFHVLRTKITDQHTWSVVSCMCVYMEGFGCLPCNPEILVTLFLSLFFKNII